MTWPIIVSVLVTVITIIMIRTAFSINLGSAEGFKWHLVVIGIGVLNGAVWFLGIYGFSSS